MSLSLHGKPGAKPKMIVRERIPLILEELGVATPKRICQRYRQKFDEPVAWTTIARHLRVLVAEGEVNEHVVTEGRGRNTALYALKS